MSSRSRNRRAYLDPVAGALRAHGLRVTWETRVGRPVEELARAVETNEADLLLLATHGRGGLRRWALGSVATDLLQRGSTSVMVVRAFATADQQVPARIAAPQLTPTSAAT